VRNNGLKVAVLGSAVDLTYDYTHLGNSTKTLIEIAEGRHPYCAKIANAKLPMIIVSDKALERDDSKALLSAVAKICENSPVVNKKNGWNGFNILHSNCSRVAALDVGLSTTVDLSKAPKKLVFILGADNKLRTDEIAKDAYVIYVGTHGDEGAYFADLILPGAAYTEKTGTYVNTEGRVLTSMLAVPPPG